MSNKVMSNTSIKKITINKGINNKFHLLNQMIIGGKGSIISIIISQNIAIGLSMERNKIVRLVPIFFG